MIGDNFHKAENQRKEFSEYILTEIDKQHDEHNKAIQNVEDVVKKLKEENNKQKLSRTKRVKDWHQKIDQMQVNLKKYKIQEL